MTITVDRNGKRKVRLTQTELKTLQRARMVCDTLHRNGFLEAATANARDALYGISHSLENGHETGNAKGDLSD